MDCCNVDTKNKFDLIIIGGGSAAFAAAIHADSMKLSTLIINDGLPLGGTCVNVGCVPSKFLIRAAESIHRAAALNFDGVTTAKPTINFAKIIKQKEDLVKDLQQHKYIDLLPGLQYVKVIEGRAKFEEKNKVEVNGEVYEGAKIIIATGATTHIPDIDGIYDVPYLTSKTLFELEQQPQSLIILGAGYIALEIAQAYQRMGTKVTIIQRSQSVLSKETKDITNELEKLLTAEGITIHTGSTVNKVWKERNKIKVFYTNAQKETDILEATHIVVATGTKGNTADLDLGKIGIEITEKGLIKVDDLLKTSAEDVFAIGDVTTNPPFVYTAAYEGGKAVVNAFKLHQKQTDFSVLPWVVFTDPQIAGVGIDEREAEEKGIPHQVTTFYLKDIPRSIVALDTRGFIKLIRNPENDLLLGARIVAPEGGELLMQLSLMIKYKIPLKEIVGMFHPYLTLSEGVKLAVMSFTTDVKNMSCCAS
ncbi:mercury(II) reductase [Flavisolibacter nicotianae]|uniref:mercury(II) reductase n=1 Tax=Flavisolibacter nicotianae TaxID=2364882 RepID=UPI000EABFAB2|nr:mercury(II) reductase [Flavisolibacter nicotianae]